MMYGGALRESTGGNYMAGGGATKKMLETLLLWRHDQPFDHFYLFFYVFDTKLFQVNIFAS
jgi:hypothetical protein